MSLLLLRALLREMIEDIPVLETGAGEPPREAGARYVIVVARTEPGVYAHLRSRHQGDRRVRVVLDRRGAGDGDATEAPPPAERRRRQSWLATGASHEVVALAEAPTAKRPISVRHQEAAPHMSQTNTLEGAQRVSQWLAEGQHVLGHAIPALIEDRDRLRHALEGQEQECERLRGELGELRSRLGALQSELDTLRGERIAMADAFGGVVDLLGQLQRPLNDIARRLQATRPVTVDTPAA